MKLVHSFVELMQSRASVLREHESVDGFGGVRRARGGNHRAGPPGSRPKPRRLGDTQLVGKLAPAIAVREPADRLPGGIG
jgi:hypothetical protein